MKRKFATISKAFFQRRHYIALWNMYLSCPNFFHSFRRYLFGWGDYPYDIRINTPSGIVALRLYSYHDMLTVNEIFFRNDYFSNQESEVVVDIGSNIGISASYFLTRNGTCRCYLFEPDPRNCERLKQNLRGFETRFLLNQVAVWHKSGVFEFGTEESGRYGGIAVKTGNYMQVPGVSVNEVLNDVLRKEHYIDILKIDIEGTEIKVVKAIDGKFLKKVRKIYLEARPQGKLLSDYFQQQYGPICILTNGSLNTPNI